MEIVLEEMLGGRVLRMESETQAVGYAVKTAEGVLVIDPPAGLHAGLLKARGWRNPDAIFVTHVQKEHVEGALPGVPVWVSAGDAYLCEGWEACRRRIQPWPEPWEWETRGRYEGHLAGAMNERPPDQPLPIKGTLRAGDTFFGFRVLATPGHGKSALTLRGRVGDTEVAFCGDIAFEGGRLWNWFDCDWDYGLEGGQRTLMSSVQKLADTSPEILFPSHGRPEPRAVTCLTVLRSRLESVLVPPGSESGSAINFPECDSPAPGFRQVAPHIHQWRSGNTILIVSDSGRAIVIDDGLCQWEPVPERIESHDRVFAEAREALRILSWDYIIPTHYHGDHIEMIPRLRELTGARVICLDCFSDVLENPSNYNLASSLPWYGAAADRLAIDLRVPEGHVLLWEGLELEFFHLGGQTAHHLGIRCDMDGHRVVFAGDAWWGTSTQPGPVLCWNEAEPRSQGWLYALDRMLERRPDLLVCGHGSALYQPLPLLEEARARWQEKLLGFDSLNPHADGHRFFNPFRPANLPS